MNAGERLSALSRELPMSFVRFSPLVGTAGVAAVNMHGLQGPVPIPTPNANAPTGTDDYKVQTGDIRGVVRLYIISLHPHTHSFHKARFFQRCHGQVFDRPQLQGWGPRPFTPWPFTCWPLTPKPFTQRLFTFVLQREPLFGRNCRPTRGCNRPVSV